MKAWELLQEKGWCQEAMARDVNGKEVNVYDSQACSYCMFGAIRKAYSRQSEGEHEALQRMRAVIQTHCIGSWNDAPGRTKAEVIAALKAADV